MSKRKLETKAKDEAPAAKRAKTEQKPSGDYDSASRSGSSKELSAVVDGHAVEIGDEIPPLGTLVKAAVMCMLNGGRRTPRFNKMSGIQEWQNCVALFVNIRGCNYENCFLSGGARITWFAQDRQSEETPVVQRLINHVADKTAVLLFCRLPGEPYVNCGALRYLHHEPGSRPLRFIFQLSDFDLLRSRPAFIRLLEEEDRTELLGSASSSAAAAASAGAGAGAGAGGKQQDESKQSRARKPAAGAAAAAAAVKEEMPSLDAGDTASTAAAAVKSESGASGESSKKQPKKGKARGGRAR